MGDIRLACFNVSKGTLEPININSDSIDDYYKYLECDVFDIAVRDVNGTVFDIFVDDEGLLKDCPVVSAIDKNFEPALVGNLIFAHHNSMGETTDLSDVDIELLKNSIINVVDMFTKKSYKVMFPVS